MAFVNRIRLPFYLKQPQWPMDRSVYRRSDGTTKVLSISVRKTFQGVTDAFPQQFHERLAIALAHDNVTIEGGRLASGVVLDGEYQVNWQDFLDHPSAPAQFQIQVTPFDVTNDNCQTCEEATQLSLEDDTFVYPLNNGEVATIDVFANDDICCSPITAGVIWWDPIYVATASLDAATGIATVVVKDYLVFGATNVLLATYRVTCPNGGYDEANIYGDIDGNEPDCAPPSDLVYSGDEITFTPSPSVPGDGYNFQIYECANLGAIVATGNTLTSPVELTGLGLAPGGCYVIALWSSCVVDLVYSEAVNLEFTLDAPASQCGSFILENTDPFGPEPILHVTYMDCNGNLQNIGVRTPQEVCALTNAISGDYYFIESAEPGLSITPNGAC